MNIWIFNHYAIGPGSTGGTRHYDLSKELVKKGHQVTIFASSFNHQQKKEERKYEKGTYFLKENHSGVNFVWIKTKPYIKNDYKRIFNMIDFSYKAYKVGKKARNSPDIIIGSLVHPLAAYVGYKVSQYHKARFFFEERDLWPQTLVDLGKFSEKNLLVRIMGSMELFLYKKAEKIIVLFDKAPEYVVSKGISKEKIIYLPNGVDLCRFENENYILPIKLEEYYKKNKQSFIITYMGSHGIANHLDVILDIAEKFNYDSKIQFNFIGDGPEKKELIKKVNLKNLKNITFHDPIAKEYVPLALKKSHLGILSIKNSPLYKWGFSANKSYDYMAAGLPVVICYPDKNIPLNKCKSIWIEDDIDKIVDIIKELSSDLDNYKKYNEISKQFVEENYNWKYLSEKLERHF